MNHEHVRDVLDRTATRPLVQRLLSEEPDADERDEIERTLVALDDVRAVLPLQAAGENPSLSPIVRISALNVITSMLGATVLPIREWWASEDPALRFAAASVLPHREFADLVGPVLGDPRHPMLARVLGSMDIGFEEGSWQALKIQSLSHIDPAVRSAAASALLWDEPLAAHDALLEATRDIDVDVAIEAVSTLMYYPTSEVVMGLRCVAESPNEFLAASAAVALERVLGDIAEAIDAAPDSVHTRRWRDLLVDPADRERLGRLRNADGSASASTSTSTSTSTSGHVASALSAPDRPFVPWDRELEQSLLDPDGAWEGKLACIRHLDGESVALADRPRVLDVLCHHADPEIRGSAAAHIAQWDGGAEALLGLLDDPMVTVSKAAMYALYDVPDEIACRPAIRDRAWHAVVDGTRVGTRLGEALRTFVRHGDAFGPEEVTRRLVALLDDPRESARTAALEHLAGRAAVDELTGQMHRLADSPEVTWAVHGTLLDAAHRHALTVDRSTLVRLVDVDHAWLSGSASRLLLPV